MVLLRQAACQQLPSGYAAVPKVPATPSSAVLSWGVRGITHAGAWPSAFPDHACTSCPWVWARMCPCWSLLGFSKVVFLLGPRLALNYVTKQYYAWFFLYIWLSNMFLQLQHNSDFSVTSLLLLWGRIAQCWQVSCLWYWVFPDRVITWVSAFSHPGNFQGLCKTSSSTLRPPLEWLPGSRHGTS